MRNKPHARDFLGRSALQTWLSQPFVPGMFAETEYYRERFEAQQGTAGALF
jgi:hypothetical protein